MFGIPGRFETYHAMYSSRALAILVAFAAVTSSSFAQNWQGRGRRIPNRDEYPNWTIEEPFADDVFTFARIQYDSSDCFAI